ncbi:hypothetical protein Q8W40_05465 [Vibrio penaeicida]|uniref:hypothetical protein n=1 Tax=Vibrio penaeicida TaxID=104609 RepID=UPI0027352F49|nr:hypothetical protein [Vibrio penaeicida]MDP2571620.1 hypothetical protein [Vibrio penaeicida]
MSNIETAIEIALKAHEHQLDKGGTPYVLHPLRLMFKFQCQKEMIVAVLHDVIEDGSITLEYLLKAGFSGDIVHSVDCLTKRSHEAYEEYILRLSKDTLARTIKIEDIKDNLDLSRLEVVLEKDLVRLKKYHRALKVLQLK